MRQIEPKFKIEARESKNGLWKWYMVDESQRVACFCTGRYKTKGEAMADGQKFAQKPIEVDSACEIMIAILGFVTFASLAFALWCTLSG